MKKLASIILLWFMTVMISCGIISRAVADTGVALVTTTKTTTQSIPTKYTICIPAEALLVTTCVDYPRFVNLIMIEAIPTKTW